jgi:heme exporter protein C
MSKRFPTSLHLGITLTWIVVSLYMIFLYAPQELTMGEVQRIFYIHFSLANTALLAYALVFFGSIGYLWKRSKAADDFALACAEVGFVFCCGVLITGPLWAKPVWGIWWTWEPRLTSTFVVWLLYIAYLMLRAYVTSPGRTESLSAVVATLGCITSIVDYMAIRWWRTQHPQPVIFGGSDSGLDPRMWLTVFVTWGAFLCLFFYLVRLRIDIARVRREVSRLRQEWA